MTISFNTDITEQVDGLFAELQQRPPATRRPASTYRIQFRREFTFRDALAQVDYFRRLGVTHIYASPVYRAMPGSPHGYDVLDLGELNPELGSDEDFRALVAGLRQAGMGLIVDFVSNHLGVGTGNLYWMDVLEGGPASEAASFFDIEWAPPRTDLHGRILLPILGDQYGAVLERGELQVEWQPPFGFCVRYFDSVVPVCLNSWHRLLSPALDKVSPPDHAALQGLLSELQGLPSFLSGDTSRGAVRDALRQQAIALLADHPALAEHIQATLGSCNGSVGDPRSFDALDTLLSEQPYRLADWRVAGEEINYRRFFDVNGLAAIRMEHQHVFARMHRLVLAWATEGLIDGLRIDHPDGLYDPAAYFTQLQEDFVVHTVRRRHPRLEPWAEVETALRQRYREVVQHDASSPLQRPLYVVVEKILAYGESMPARWPIDGTTGYEFLNAVNGLLVDGHQRNAMEALYTRFTRKQVHFKDLVYRKKKLVMADAMSSEINMLAHRLSRIAGRNRITRDFTQNSLKRALVEFIACLGVYRTYLNGAGGGLEPRDQHYIRQAIDHARHKSAGQDPSIYDFLQRVLLLQTDDRDDRSAVLAFVLKLQQLTGAITAKGVEDTAFYIYNRLLSLNEVGGEPERFGRSVWEFHSRNRERVAHWHGGLSSTSTHDTKRGEDVRARLDVLSEIPSEWRYHLGLWSRIHQIHKQEVRGRLAPDRNEEYYLYQLIVGTWPRSLEVTDDYRQRIKDSMRKALREAKVHSGWLNNNLPYEDAVLQFVDQVLSHSTAFMADLVVFMRKVALAGLHNSLTQTFLKIVSPGVPDIYQGCEVWDDSLVDPDNRRLVDFGLRARLMDELDRLLQSNAPTTLYRKLLDPLDDGLMKLYVTRTALRFRREHEELFRTGRYMPLEASERLRDHVAAFARHSGDHLVVVAAPCRVYHLLANGGLLKPEVWEDTWLHVPGPPTTTPFLNVLTGQQVQSSVFEERPGLRLADILGDFPVALLVRQGT